MAKEEKWIDWDKPITVLNLVAIIALGVFVLAQSTAAPKTTGKKPVPPKLPGCFAFDDGSTQGWTLDQLYIARPEPKPGQPQKKVQSVTPKPKGGYYTITPFQLKNHNNIALEANSTFYLIADKKVELCDIYFESPDLSANSDWQNLAGYSVDVRREFASLCAGDPPNTFYVQFQVKVIEKATKKEKLFSETETIAGKEEPKFHEIKLNKPYHFVWKAAVFSDPKYTIKQLHIRCTAPGYGMPGECPWSGSWKIGNVCPEK